MKLEITNGCYGISMTVDGQRLEDMTTAEQWEVVRLLLSCKKLHKHMGELIHNISMLIEPDDEEFANEPCETCGEWFHRAEYQL